MTNSHLAACIYFSLGLLVSPISYGLEMGYFYGEYQCLPKIRAERNKARVFNILFAIGGGPLWPLFLYFAHGGFKHGFRWW